MFGDIDVRPLTAVALASVIAVADDEWAEHGVRPLPVKSRD